ncbi:hypothetical protein [Parabacteroides provencensis]|uniref:hypothetical protein n=1 Tax=Parabacteroides provencensis TaxID=1944636 RepID=UPI000C1567BB|nr:hypothetical protein [Parabacteroides provencensis]
MKTIEELESDLKIATEKWENILAEQSDMVDNAISDYQLCEIDLSILISKLQDVENMDDLAWKEKNAIEIEINNLKNNRV